MLDNTQRRKPKSGNINRFLFLFVIIAIFAVFAITQEHFASAGNLLDVFTQGSLYAVLLIGLTWVLSVGEIDASFPDVAAFASVFSAVMINLGVPADLAAVIVLGASCLFGLFSGVLVTKFKFPAIIVTIAVSSVARAFGLILAGGKNITLNMPDGQFSLFNTVASGTIGSVPILLIFGIIVIAIMWFIQDKLRFGQCVYAIGDNKKAAQNAGIPVNKTIRTTFILSSAFAGLGGILLGMNAGSGRPFMGSLLFLDSFTKVFLGAMVFKLGKTNAIGTYFGCVFLGIVANGLTFMGATSWVQSIVTGGLLVAGVMLTSVLEKKRQKLTQLEL